MVKTSRDFQRDGNDIVSSINISFPEAALGVEKNIKTVDGKITIKIPSGIQSGTIIKMSKRGVPKLKGSGRGDHLLTVIVKTPERLSRKEKEAYESIK